MKIILICLAVALIVMTSQALGDGSESMVKSVDAAEDLENSEVYDLGLGMDDPLLPMRSSRGVQAFFARPARNGFFMRPSRGGDAFFTRPGKKAVETFFSRPGRSMQGSFFARPAKSGNDQRPVRGGTGFFMRPSRSDGFFTRPGK